MWVCGAAVLATNAAMADAVSSQRDDTLLAKTYRWFFISDVAKRRKKRSEIRCHTVFLEYKITIPWSWYCLLFWNFSRVCFGRAPTGKTVILLQVSTFLRFCTRNVIDYFCILKVRKWCHRTSIFFLYIYLYSTLKESELETVRDLLSAYIRFLVLNYLKANTECKEIYYMWCW